MEDAEATAPMRLCGSRTSNLRQPPGKYGRPLRHLLRRKTAHAVFYREKRKFYNRITINGCRIAIINRKLQHIHLYTVIQAVFLPKML